MLKNLFLWLVIALVLIFVFSNFGPRAVPEDKLTYSQFLQAVNQGNITSAVIEGDSIHGLTQNNKAVTTTVPMQDPFLINQLLNHNVDISGKAPEQGSMLAHIFVSWFPMLLLIGVWVFFMRQMQGGGGRGAMSFGRSRARLL